MTPFRRARCAASAESPRLEGPSEARAKLFFVLPIGTAKAPSHVERHRVRPSTHATNQAVTVSKPSLPFEVTIDVKEDDPIGISVTGSASNGGKLTATYAFVDSGGIDPVETSAECGR